LWLDYPSFDDEVRIVKTTTSEYSGRVEHVLAAEDIIGFQELVRCVPTADNVVEFAVRLARKTRPTASDASASIKKWVRWGAGPRASQNLILGAKARAILHGRATPDIADVIALAGPVLRHRLVTSFTAEAEGVTSMNVIENVLREVQ
jgi:MoxR-like ATPase